MRLLLDTNVCIDVLRGRPEVVTRLREHPPGYLYVSAITVFELVQGAERAPDQFRESERRKVNTFLSPMIQVIFDGNCGALAGQINAALLNAGTPVGVMDVFIAATALQMDVPIVTSNVRDFSKIKGLEVIDWREGKA
ncbi:MAG: type II toxin-antitoxin system VapC family toxin [Verrucomicrobiota bacterium]